jgi:hypothetical protein
VITDSNQAWGGKMREGKDAPLKKKFLNEEIRINEMPNLAI